MREERLHDSGFHVEGAGAVGFARSEPERHFFYGARGVDSVVMAEYEELTVGARRI